MENTKFSILELAVITENGSAATSLKNALELAQHAEKLGYTRFWLAEHHNASSIASSATVVLIGYIAGGTKKIRVGSGGIMLPNHVPLIVAEQFGTLETLYPGRIDLGLGRAPGTDRITARALRREEAAILSFKDNIEELQHYFAPKDVTKAVRAIPGEGLEVPVYILGSSTDSAHLAAKLGLPYAFAAHFAPRQFEAAIDIYRNEFKPSKQLQEPYVIACVNAAVADTQQEAEFIASSAFLMFRGVISGRPVPLMPPVANINEVLNEYEKTVIAQMLSMTFIGDKSSVQSQLDTFIKRSGVDEVMFTAHIYDHAARLRSYELLSEIFTG
ncbi:LLM class flavin-dependent oxidoreductase [Haoranjiania flava]|uniref:Luciferase-like monooxygenase n=1 Tax=Haoranjiania flava TaxID=1856322 RepID=A0AAE3IQR0_9BACT|nr:LLM class flavin-dependent oxidoreductase [Haoranjiania flava]MCU7695348.1 LLM class flavin-dependent oxidoreductase [Haoranjiania flava]